MTYMTYDLGPRTLDLEQYADLQLHSSASGGSDHPTHVVERAQHHGF
jgi:hypothetical protein